MNEKVSVNSAVRVVRHDSIPLAKAHYTEEGYLVDTPVVTSVGIFEYKNDDGSIRKELRLPEHVFKPESLQSYKGKPIIVTHDAGLVNKNNVSDESVGTILSEGFRDGNDVRAEIIIHDANELKRCGLKELSLGYSLDLVEEPGEWNGQHYDAVQTNIIINHLALVANARAGEQARLNIDSKDEKLKKGGTEMSTKPKKKAKRRDEDDLAVELAKAVLEETAQPEVGAVTDSEGTEAAPEQSEAQGGSLAPSEELLKSIRDRKDRRDSEQEEAPTNLDEANEIIRQQNEDIDTLISMLDKKNEEKAPSSDEEGNTDSEEESNQDNDTVSESAEENADCGDNVNKDNEEEKAPALNADSIDALVRARAAMSRLGEKYNIDGLDELSMCDAMRRVIAFATPGIRLDSEAELKGAFKVAVASLKNQKTIADQRSQMYSGVRTDSSEKSEADSARQRMINSRK